MEEKEKNTPKKKSNVIVIICLVVMVLAIIGTVVAVVVFGKKDKEISIEKVETKDVQSSAYRLSGNSLEDFDLYFLQLENEPKNKVYSPLSIKYALAMLNDGTEGTTRSQINSVLGDYKAKRYNNNEHMSFANAMFIREAYKEKVKEEYTNKVNHDFGAEIIYDPFENSNNLNSWVSNKTFNLIDKLISDDIVQNGDFFLINALAIDMNWINRLQNSAAPLPEGMKQLYYHVSYAHENYSDGIESILSEQYPTMNFNGQENTKSTKVGASFNHYDIISDVGEENIRKNITEKYQKYLEEGGGKCADSVEEYVDGYVSAISSNYKKADISTDFSIYVSDDMKVFAKDLQTYDGTTLQYIGIMPREVALETYIKESNAESISKVISNLKVVEYENFKEGVVTKIKGNIPLFKFDYQLDLIGDLKKLGITDVFDRKNSDLSKLTTVKDAYIFDATHKATIEFSNDGIKAAAATSMGGGGAAGCGFDYKYDVPVEEIDITFDKPYLFLVRDKETGEVWFAGTVYNPTVQ